MATVITLGCVLLALNAAPPASSSKPRITIHVIGPKDTIPPLVPRIIFSARGDLRNIMSHPLDDTDLKRMLRPSKPGEIVSIEIKASTEEETSIATLMATLERVKKSIHPRTEARIYLYFQSLTGPGRTLD